MNINTITENRQFFNEFDLSGLFDDIEDESPEITPDDPIYALVQEIEATYKDADNGTSVQPENTDESFRRPRREINRRPKKDDQADNRVSKFVPEYRLRTYYLNTATADAAQSAVWSAKASHDSGYSYIDFFNHLPKDNNQVPQYRHLSKQFVASLHELELYRLQIENPAYIAVPFVMNLSESVARKAQDAYRDANTPEITTYQRLINKAITKTIRRFPVMWFSLEMADNGETGKPHLQGTMLVKPSEVRRVRDALHRINGEVSVGFKRHAVRFLWGCRKLFIKERGLLSALIGWGVYSTKETDRVKLRYLQRNPGMKRQATMYQSRLLTQRVKATYETTRTEWLNIGATRNAPASQKPQLLPVQIAANDNNFSTHPKSKPNAGATLAPISQRLLIFQNRINALQQKKLVSFYRLTKKISGDTNDYFRNHIRTTRGHFRAANQPGNAQRRQGNFLWRHPP